ncbi:MAG: methionine--tRNA ligase [Lachnospiraceae bacterium]|nr:methionine--tRNA ligase [Lachnospiraceae bacterium]
MKNILIAGAWPYANGSLHIGHVAGLLAGDVLARYHRAKGDRVCYVSGSDCHGTPVALRAKREGLTPWEVSDRFHEEFSRCFQWLGFGYDLYSKTSSEEHIRFVQEFHEKLYGSPYVYEKEVPQAYCEGCKSFLADRFVTGKCPVCGEAARGDQCDACGEVLEPEQLVEPVCAVCGERISFRNTRHLYIAISKLEKELKAYVESHENWRKNAVALSKRYIEEGLRDRALTRDLDWGIDVPRKGYEDKKIYIWAENVLGYLSLSRLVAKERGWDFKELWGEEARHYYVHGKDNIPFHTIILPALLLAEGEDWHLPDHIISSEYLTLEGKKISTSQNYAIWVKDLIGRYEADSLRYYLLANGAEKRDADFSWQGFITSHNNELLGAWGNFVNRTLIFITKYLDGRVPDGSLEKGLEEEIDRLYEEIGKKVEGGRLKEAIDDIFAFVRFSNKYFDLGKPWITRNTSLRDCRDTLYNCVQLIVNLAVLLEPFLPFSSEKVLGWFLLDSSWKRKTVPTGFVIPETEILFRRIDRERIGKEEEKLRA